MWFNNKILEIKTTKHSDAFIDVFKFHCKEMETGKTRQTVDSNRKKGPTMLYKWN